MGSRLGGRLGGVPLGVVDAGVVVVMASRWNGGWCVAPAGEDQPHLRADCDHHLVEPDDLVPRRRYRIYDLTGFWLEAEFGYRAATWPGAQLIFRWGEFKISITPPSIQRIVDVTDEQEEES